MPSGWIRIGLTFLSVLVLSTAQECPNTTPFPGVSLSVVGDGSGLDAYLATIRKNLKLAWIDAWPSETPEPGRFVVTLHINHSGYLDQIDGRSFVPNSSTGTLQKKPVPGKDSVSEALLKNSRDPARDERLHQMWSAVRHAVTSVFEGVPAEPPDEYPQSQIILKVTFAYSCR